jgi:hypothetical protein
MIEKSERVNKQAAHFDIAVVIEQLTTNNQMLPVDCDGNLGSVQNQFCSSHFIKHIQDCPCHLFSFPRILPLLLPMLIVALSDAIFF